MTTPCAYFWLILSLLCSELHYLWWFHGLFLILWCLIRSVFMFFHFIFWYFYLRWFMVWYVWFWLIFWFIILFCGISGRFFWNFVVFWILQFIIVNFFVFWFYLNRFWFELLKLWTFAYVQLLNKLYINEVTLTEQNLSLKGCKPLEFLIHLRKGIRSFHTINIESLSQRASNLLAFKVEGSPKKSATYMGSTG